MEKNKKIALLVPVGVVIVLIACLSMTPPITKKPEIQCRYVTDYQQNQEEWIDSTISSSMIPLKPSKNDIMKQFVDFVNIAISQIDNDIFYCTYKENENAPSKKDALEFLRKLRDKKIVPIYFYDGLTSNFYEVYNYDDINTPFSQKREQGAQQFEFVFRKRSVKSTIKFFGFLFTEDNSLLCWAVDKHSATIRPANQEEYKEIMKKYLKDIKEVVEALKKV